MGTLGNSVDKYVTGRMLRTSNDRRWSHLLAEIWSHEAGELPSQLPRDTEIAIQLRGHSLVERRGAGMRQRPWCGPWGPPLRDPTWCGDCSDRNRLASQNMRDSFPKLRTPWRSGQSRAVGYACSLRTLATSSGAGVDGRARHILA